MRRSVRESVCAFGTSPAIWGRYISPLNSKPVTKSDDHTNTKVIVQCLEPN